MVKLTSVLVLSSLLMASPVAIADHNYKSTAHRPLTERQVEHVITHAATFVGVPAYLMLAICWHESKYKQNLPEPLDGKTPSYGICQVKLETAQFMDQLYKLKIPATVERLRDPYVNAYYAAKYMKWQLQRYEGDWKKAVVAYNSGSWDEETEYLVKVEMAMQEKHLVASEQ